MLVAFLIAVASAVIALLVACEASTVPRRRAAPGPEVAKVVRPVAGDQAVGC